jgi:mannose-6-phosphate isomerase-like protein (cupin superfamily)
MIRNIALLTAAFAGLLSVAAAAQTTRNATPPDDFKYLSAGDAAALVNKPGPAPVVSLLSDHEYYFSEVVARSADGEVEVHHHWIDFVTILSGEATLTYGGVVAGAKETTPGEMRGGTIAGGKTIALHRGDYLEIPADMPHLMTGPKHNFSYLIVKVRV